MKATTTIVILILCSSFFACHQPKLQSPSGYTYVHHIQNDTLKPAAGDKVHFQVDMRLANHVLHSSRTTTTTSPSLFMRDLTLVNQPSPIEECLYLMGVGDSLSFSIRVDTLYNEPGVLEQVAYLSYDLKLLSIETKKAMEDQRTVSRH